jgi:hypothetical protein
MRSSLSGQHWLVAPGAKSLNKRRLEAAATKDRRRNRECEVRVAQSNFLPCVFSDLASFAGIALARWGRKISVVRGIGLRSV